MTRTIDFVKDFAASTKRFRTTRLITDLDGSGPDSDHFLGAQVRYREDTPARPRFLET